MNEVHECNFLHTDYNKIQTYKSYIIFYSETNQTIVYVHSCIKK